MIARMKKITAVCLETAREEALEQIRKAGVLHVTPAQAPQGSDLDQARQALHRAESAAAILAPFAKTAKPAPRAAALPVETAVERAHELQETAKSLGEEIESLRTEYESAEPYGDFDPALLAELGRRGIRAKLCHVTVGHDVHAPEGTTVLVTRSDAGGTWAVVVGTGDFSLDVREDAPPRRRLREIAEAIAATRSKAEAAEQELAGLAVSLPAVQDLAARCRDAVRFAEARAGMGREASLSWIRGFCPADRVDDLRAAARSAGFGLLIEDPTPEDAVPTLIRMPRWVRPIEALFQLTKILPGYHEPDVSAAFLLFLTLFCAMIIGDAGYGLVFLAGVLGMRFRMRGAPSGPFTLLTIFSLATIVWGVLAGTYFGVTDLPIWKIRWLTDPEAGTRNVMTLCLIIGAGHLTLAHLWNAIRFINTWQSLAQFGWIAVVWAIFFAAQSLISGQTFPAWYRPVAVGGLALIVLFMTPLRRLKSDFINHAMLPLSLFSAFGDVLSYLRLFALGVAGVEVARACNSMASGLTGSVPRIAGAALVLLIGHGLNIVLCALSVLVHGIRLNALEFSMHLGLEWSGGEYRPFREEAGAAV